MRRFLTLAVLPCLAAGCASQPADPAAVDKVAVHESVASLTRPYEVIKRVWVDSMASNVYLPTYASRDAAVRAFQQHAAEAGGDGVINFGCYRWGDQPDAALGCNGTVVRFR